MPDPNADLAARWRAAIASFLQDRLQAKLDKLSPEDPKRDELIAQFVPVAWLDDAARRVRQIQAVTHALKPMHPDARGTNLYVPPAQLPTLTLVGSHALGKHFATDIVGNAAALDVYKFLKVAVDGRSLLDALLADDPAVLAVLANDIDAARALRDAFVSITQPREGGVATHTRAKQVYWLVGDDAAEDEGFHLLAPLYATSLTHAVHGVIQEDRFGDANKAARAARRAKAPHDGVLHDYPELAVQKLGGTKPQNISQLNSERGGVNYLLASLPPRWEGRASPQPWGITSVIDTLLLNRPGVRSIVQALLRFLVANPPANVETRNRVEDAVSSLIDELVAMAGELRRAWPEGWTADSRCDLVMEEQLWLDSARAETDADFRVQWMQMDWPMQIGHRFGNWLNARLDRHLSVGEVEQRQWRKELLADESAGGWARDLHKLRAQLDAPQYIASRSASV